MVKTRPELKNVEPFKTVLSGDREAIAKLSMTDLEKIARRDALWHDGGRVQGRCEKWISTAKDPRWHRPYTELTYQPMHEVMQYLRANGFKTYIVTGGGQDFVRSTPIGSTASRPSRSSAPRAGRNSATTRMANRS